MIDASAFRRPRPCFAPRREAGRQSIQRQADTDWPDENEAWGRVLDVVHGNTNDLNI